MNGCVYVFCREVDAQDVYESRAQNLIFLSGSEEGADNDSKVILTENLGKFSGTTFDVYVEKIIHGRVLVLVDGEWYARLNHYDYGQNYLEFKAVGELYYEGVFNLQAKQIV